MEAKNVKIVSLMVIVMLGMFVEKSSAFDKTCFVGCLVKCALRHPSFTCPLICVAKCIFHGTPSNKIESLGDFCKLGCATTKCISQSTPQNPRGDQVEHCVNSYCANICKN
ncbi:hypothetical protein MKX01_032621 [Papaver californicum]|nr:hypothetical protein MKX01_031222 [Papaver californicum]KAI3926433.1 hypothetical protein MKX01_032621 [Papaver californicum]